MHFEWHFPANVLTIIAWGDGLQGKLKGFEQKYIFPAPLIDPIGKIAKEWHGSNRSHKVNDTSWKTQF